jgi:IS30 family transposase
MKKATKLSKGERNELQLLHDKGYSARGIAKVLGRSPNTIASELKRNGYESTGVRLF